ncbi:MAG TPA: hypothetical protein VK503_01425 [Candidatus Bathyarchaeia archaeon]|nr:hypothetical protein [Candidatus Bathyarchaeia archaeon]
MSTIVRATKHTPFRENSLTANYTTKGANTRSQLLNSSNSAISRVCTEAGDDVHA